MGDVSRRLTKRECLRTDENLSAERFATFLHQQKRIAGKQHIVRGICLRLQAQCQRAFIYLRFRQLRQAACADDKHRQFALLNRQRHRRIQRPIRVGADDDGGVPIGVRHILAAGKRACPAGIERESPQDVRRRCARLTCLLVVQNQQTGHIRARLCGYQQKQQPRRQRQYPRFRLTHHTPARSQQLS